MLGQIVLGYCSHDCFVTLLVLRKGNLVERPTSNDVDICRLRYLRKVWMLRRDGLGTVQIRSSRGYQKIGCRCRTSMVRYDGGVAVCEMRINWSHVVVAENTFEPEFG